MAVAAAQQVHGKPGTYLVATSAAASIVYPRRRALDDKKELMMEELVMEELAREGTIVAKVRT